MISGSKNRENVANNRKNKEESSDDEEYRGLIASHSSNSNDENRHIEQNYNHTRPIITHALSSIIDTKKKQLDS